MTEIIEQAPAPRRMELTIEPGTELLIRVVGGSGAPSTTQPAPPAQNPPDSAVEEVIRRLEEYGSPYAREAAQGLKALGYLLVAPTVRVQGKAPESYLRFLDPARPGAAIGYLTPQNISFTRDRELLANEPGGRVIPSTREVAFSHME